MQTQTLTTQKKINPVVEIYGSLMVEQTEFALNVKCVQEIIRFPDKITKVPLAPSFLLGVFNLRGVIIPLISLKKLLHFESEDNLKTARIAIVEHSGAKVGLLFDSTGEILRIREDEKSNFDYNVNSTHKVIGGALRLDGGNRLLQLIDPVALVNIENIPQVLQNQQKQISIQQQRGRRHKCISFYAGGVRMAFEISGIHEILRVPQLKRSALESKLCIGMIQVRGQIIPVVDFSSLLGQNNEVNLEDKNQRIIVFKIEKNFFGLLVDSVNSITTYYENDILPIPLLSKDRAEMFKGCLDSGDAESFVLLNHLGILSNDEIGQLTQGHSKIYQTEEPDATKKRSNRQVYISFRVDQLFAVPIGDVKEIISYPKDLMPAPGAPLFMRGLLNLRGEMVTIVDARKLYKLTSETTVKAPKVLIFQSGAEKFGLVVDSVETILSIHDEQKMKLPSLLYAQLAETYAHDIKEAVYVSHDSGDKTSVVVLNIEPLADRIRGGKAAS